MFAKCAKGRNRAAVRRRDVEARFRLITERHGAVPANTTEAAADVALQKAREQMAGRYKWSGPSVFNNTEEVSIRRRPRLMRHGRSDGRL